jgi:hypothetical protein
MTSMEILQGCKISIVTKQGIRTRGDAPARSCAEVAESGCNVALPQDRFIADRPIADSRYSIALR